MYCDVRSYTCIFFGVRQAMYNTFTRWQDCAAPARRVNQRVAMLGAPETTPKVTRWPQPRDAKVAGRSSKWGRVRQTILK